METGSIKKLSRAEYLWLDGTANTQELRSKTRMLPYELTANLEFFPEWSFDGSSTAQAEGHDSDCILKPVFFTPDPLRGKGNYIVLCEVFSSDRTVHPTNKRAELREILKKGGQDAEAYIGFEQEYTLYKNARPLGWPKNGFPAPQGPFYCGVGTGRVYGRELVEKHMTACEEAGLHIYGVNAEVMPAQWEFQIGYRGFDDVSSDPLTMSDHIWIARYLLSRLAEQSDVQVSYDNKPVRGDWNGAGMHTNFSTKEMRAEGGIKVIEKSIERLEKRHKEHIDDYGFELASRLTGLHETCSIDEFKSGVSHRGASIRIPIVTHQKGRGYFEDRRPGANANPYLVSARLLETLCLD